MPDTEFVLAGTGTAGDVRTYSGIPHFLLSAARELEGLDWDDAGFDTNGPEWTLRRYAWNLKSFLLGRGTGGYQFTDAFLEELWKSAQPRFSGRHVLNWTQLYPTSLVSDDSIIKSFYIDQTLGQLFLGYGVGASIRTDVADSAIRRECIGYSRAHAVITTSEWGRSGVLATYAGAPERVHVVHPGANFPLSQYRRWAATHRLQPSNPIRPLRLLFIGLHPMRKGLDRLLRAIVIARSAGSNIELTIVGTVPSQLDASLRSTSGVHWIGRVNKLTELNRLLCIAGEHDIGCLLSRAEASAISLREYQAMGLGVLGPDVGGCPELVAEGAGQVIGPEASDDDIAGVLVEVERDRSKVDDMRAIAWNARETLLWPHAAKRIARILTTPAGMAPEVDAE
jgi:glycosyltransferase involved in cell wall biosynthesis